MRSDSPGSRSKPVTSRAPWDALPTYTSVSIINGARRGGASTCREENTSADGKHKRKHSPSFQTVIVLGLW